MKMVVGAVMFVVLIVCAAYFGSHWYYGADPVPINVEIEPPRVSVGTATDSDFDELPAFDDFDDESDAGIVASASPDEKPNDSDGTDLIDELSSASWDWEAEVSKAREEPTVTDLSDQELRERFLANVESGKFARKLREYFEREHGKCPEVDVLVRYYDKLVKGQAMLSDSIEFTEARLALDLAESQEAESIDKSIEHLEKHGDEPVGGTLTVTSLDRL